MQYTLKEWQFLYKACPIQTRHSVKDGDFLCTRIENTHFAIARTFGSVSVAGNVFRYAVARPGDGLDGGELIVRKDFLNWIDKEGRALVTARRRENAPVQPELF